MRTLLIVILLPWATTAQDKIMTPEVYQIWNKISDVEITDDGKWVSYRVHNEGGDSYCHLKNTTSDYHRIFKNAHEAKFDVNQEFFVYTTKAHPDTITAFKKRKIPKKNWQKDTTRVHFLETGLIQIHPYSESYKLSQDYSGCIAIKSAPRSIGQDSTLVKKENKDNGTLLKVFNSKFKEPVSIPFTKSYDWSKTGGKLMAYTSGNDSLSLDELVVYDATSHKVSTILKDTETIHQFDCNEDGSQIFIIADTDTTENTTNEAFLWNEKSGLAKKVINYNQVPLSSSNELSPDMKPIYLVNHNNWVYGIRPIPIAADTSLTDDEKVNVEVWHYQDGLIYTQQKKEKEKESKRAFATLYNTSSGQSIPLATAHDPEAIIDAEMRGHQLITHTMYPYQQLQSWEGKYFKDIYATDLNSGKKTLIAQKVDGQPRVSPDGKYLSWYSRTDTTWIGYNLSKSTKKTLTRSGYYDELNDRPMDPRESGFLGWTDDSSILIYDHYDIWKVALENDKPAVQLTHGRQTQTRYRYIKLDDDLRTLPSDTTILLSSFNEKSKHSGYAYLDLENNNLSTELVGPYRYASAITKAQNATTLLYTKESYDLFPDLILDNTDFSSGIQFSAANPQQQEYAWGRMELFEWTDSYGNTRQATLTKPPGFDAAKKYPLLVNFYEKSSNRLYQHRAPYPHRSTINYSYYTNKGYVVFNPDIYYEDGYPGESCYNAVMSSVNQLIEKGFIDTSNMGLQGHSWGGYQIAYLLTKTNRFKCAEAGAPVVNMISAYGGIRWRTGKSRMFQYEHTQSRLGADLWSRPDLYIHNSPIFNLDKVNTPVLIMHNDKDGAVPWYQGIEYFAGLRRLGKPAWLLNYNDEPHWPVKKQNRIDFNIRMEQFFDHYLMGKPIPEWMKNGIPAINAAKVDGLNYSN